ncbi:NACHT domain-containing protein [Amycolatopsis sp. A133]|uniref:NACHT domain-containing protein n=1 Tax=Amycolatopsis sp. A133 TaxID=3064472 RepID=UPI0027FCB95C|nr:NACHT domain-containing protein [Amycolatopsis sp. A133]MDQ7809392.1 NACHT domain-containing protein [Amycolatopsis sp. A133]
MRILRIVLSGIGVAALVAATVVLVELQTRGGEIATVLALFVAVVAALPTLGTWIRDRRGRSEAAAEELAQRLRAGEAATLAQLLGDPGDPSSADVGFRRREGLARRADGGGPHGSVLDVAGYYCALDRGRLLVLGDAGAGKTVLLIKLALDLLGKQPAADAAARPLPVRMNLASFDPFPRGERYNEITSARLSEQFESWLVTQLRRRGIGQQNAARLVAGGRILPLLDGLDEIGDVGRSAAVLRALNFGARSRPFVLTCRAGWFGRLAPAEQLRDATVVELEPLSPATIRDYIVEQLGTRAMESRWRRTLDAFSGSNSRDPGRSSPFQHALSSPWRLYLCVTAFAERGDPYAELAELTADEITAHLLTQLIPALTEQHPRRDGGRWQREDVERWLRGMTLSSETLIGDNADIALPAVWRTAGRVLPRVIGGFGQAILGWGLGAVALCVQYPSLLTVDVPAGTAVVVFSACMVTATAFMCMGMPVMVSTLSLHTLRTRRGRLLLLTKALPWCLLGGAAVAGVAALVLSPEDALPVGVMSFALMLVQLSAGRRPLAMARPSQLVRLSMGFDVVAAITCGIGFGIVAYVVGKPAVPAAILGAFLLARPTWFRYLAAIVTGRWRSRLPARPGQLMDWAYEAGLVRLAGVGVEFRHAELREWLTGDHSGAALSGNTRVVGGSGRHSGSDRR